MENLNFVPQRPSHPALALILAHPDVFSRQGVVEAQWRGKPPSRRGPYYCLRFRIAGRHRSIYLGRPGPLVEQVRDLLLRLQTPVREDRAYQKYRHHLMALVRSQKSTLNARLGSLGLCTKGFEIRGWRKSMLRF